MEVLHICSYYIGNKLYMNLMKQLSAKGINQHVFIPVKDSKHEGSNQLPSEYINVSYHYKNIIKRSDKFLYYRKINKQMKEIEAAVFSQKKIDFIHAHTVFSDGGTTYKLYKKYGINYIVSVRNTDINSFFKYGVHLRPFMSKILLNASAIVFISHAYKKQLFSLLPSIILTAIEDKCIVIPNGIDHYWHENAIAANKEKNSKEISMLFIGAINTNKNLKAVIQACALLLNKGMKASLHVIGNGPLEEECKLLCNERMIAEHVFFHGYISDQSSIKDIMDTCDVFVMPSFKETFGLVYIEAMTRGIPVVYTKGQGIDGYFPEGEIGYSVDPLDAKAIVGAVQDILENYDKISGNCVRNSQSFDWNIIGEKYMRLYKKRNL